MTAIMLPKGLATFVAAITLLVASPAFAAKGTVVAECNSYYLVLTNKGYAILQWFGGSLPQKGETLVGDFERYGMKSIFNLTRDRDVRVWVDQYWLSKDDAYERFFEHCS